jgi:hypothetical protein
VGLHKDEAMAKAVKKTTQQQVIESALMFAPAPIRQLASSPLGSKVLFIAISGLLATGALTVDWNNGTPQLEFHREKVEEARERIVDDLQSQGIDWRQVQAQAAANGTQLPGLPSNGLPSTAPGYPSTSNGYAPAGAPPYAGAQPYAGAPPYAGNPAPAQPQGMYTGYQGPSYNPVPPNYPPATGYQAYQQPPPNPYPQQPNAWNQAQPNGYYPQNGSGNGQPQYPLQGYNVPGQQTYPPGPRR